MLLAHFNRWITAGCVAVLGAIYSLVLLWVINRFVLETGERLWFHAVISQRLGKLRGTCRNRANIRPAAFRDRNDAMRRRTSSGSISRRSKSSSALVNEFGPRQFVGARLQLLHEIPHLTDGAGRNSRRQYRLAQRLS